MAVLSDDELIDILENRIPDLLDRRPDLYKRIYAGYVHLFATREEVAAIMEELRRLTSRLENFQAETNANFQRVDERLDRVDQRFEQVDQRFDRVEHRLDSLDRKFEDLRDWVELVIGRMQVRSGRNLEDVVAGAMRVALKRPDIRPESIRLRQKIVDQKGLVFPRGRRKEVDLIATDGEYLAFEVKSAAEVDDVENFAEKVELLRLQNPDKLVKGVFITLAPEPDVRQRCLELGIELAR
jgi:hypothetical protein